MAQFAEVKRRLLASLRGTQGRKRGHDSLCPHLRRIIATI